MTCKTFLRRYQRYLIIWMFPILLLPLPLLIHSQISACGYMLLLMAVYWVTECIPLGITGLIPVVLAPALGILTLKNVCNNYLSDAVMFFTGAIVVALAVERSNLHKRIALIVLIRMGTSLKWLLLGFSLVTCVISMFITNTATVAMMLPIVDAILKQLDDVCEITNRNPHGEKNCFDLKRLTANQCVEEPVIPLQVDCESRNETEKANRKRFGKCLTLMTTYAAQCGGTAALTGCSTNVIMKGLADKLWQSHGFEESPVTYASWLMFGIPITLTNIFVIYLWMTFYHLGFSSFARQRASKADKDAEKHIQDFLRKEKEELGAVSFSECVVSSLFFILVLLWFFRSPGFIPGWSQLFQKGYVGTATPTILVVILLFAIPSNIRHTNGDQKERVPPLMDWNTVNTRMPWNLVFLMGGGFALADACEKSGLSMWMGAHLSILTTWNSWFLVFVLCLCVCFFTEVISNPATCSIIIPIVASMAVSIGKNPLYLMFPTVTCSSYAFMLPVASPQNALTFTSGRIKMIDMIKSGFILNILCVFSVTIATQTYGYACFDFGTSPWPVNITGTFGTNTNNISLLTDITNTSP